MSTPTFKTWKAYQKAFPWALSISKAAQLWPSHERFSLTDQIRRSSRSVSANLAEACAKRRYPKHFISKLTDCLGETEETQVHLDFALAEGYIDSEVHRTLSQTRSEVARLLHYMIRNPGQFAEVK